MTKNVLQDKCNCSAVDDFTKIIHSVIDMFDSVGNDYLLFKKLVELKLVKHLDDPRYEFTISKSVGVVFKDGTPKFEETNTTAMIMPIRFQIKEFLSRHNRLKEVLSNIQHFSTASSTIISHFLQGSTCKNILSFFPVGTIVIPLGLYTDGMQYNNSLGTHTDSTDMFYYFFPALNDPLHRNNMHLASVIRSKFIKT